MNKNLFASLITPTILGLTVVIFNYYVSRYFPPHPPHSTNTRWLLRYTVVITSGDHYMLKIKIPYGGLWIRGISKWEE